MLGGVLGRSAQKYGRAAVVYATFRIVASQAMGPFKQLLKQELSVAAMPIFRIHKKLIVLKKLLVVKPWTPEL